MYASMHFLKAFGVTIRRFAESILDDLKWFFKGGFGNRYTPEALAVRQSPKARGVFAVQYPRERLPLPERYRGLPILIADEKTGEPLCTACGTCAKACPPQCIWITRATDPETGKPLKRPAEFTIDVSICMNCGFCAELCLFGAIKMDHDTDVALFESGSAFLWNKEKLLRPTSYHAEIHPTDYAEAQAKKLAKKKAKEQTQATQ